jgi:hypothetical protein
MAASPLPLVSAAANDGRPQRPAVAHGQAVPYQRQHRSEAPYMRVGASASAWLPTWLPTANATKGTQPDLGTLQIA